MMPRSTISSKKATVKAIVMGIIINEKGFTAILLKPLFVLHIL
nr:hypothetical protein [Flavobacterium sp. MC2016-06]